MSTATAATPKIRVVVAKDGMSCVVILRRPSPDESPINCDQILAELAANSVIFGIDETIIREALNAEKFNEPIVVASGIAPGRGVASTFTYHFQTSFQHKPHEDADGNVDYRDLSFLQNIEAGGLLITKTPPTQGQSGMSVLGKELPGTIGRDIPFDLGTNVKVSEDGLQLVAATSGMIQYSNGRASVQNCLTIPGSVDHTVGNLTCKGSIKIAGDVKAGFKIRTDGDVEIGGAVEEATIIAGGSIMVRGGFFGKGEGLLSAGGDIVLKFAESQRLEAGRSVYIGEELNACTVNAKESVVVKGKKGRILGGTILAGKEIRAPFIGSEIGTRTRITVGFTTEVMKRVAEINAELKRLTEDEERVKEGLVALLKLEMARGLPDEKKATLESLKAFRDKLPAHREQLEAEKSTLLESIKQLQECAVVCEKTCYPGVRVSIGNGHWDVTDAIIGVKFALNGNSVAPSDWKPDGR